MENKEESMNVITKKQRRNRHYRTCAHFTAAIITAVGLSGCFLFDDGTKQGFTIDGVYDGDTNTKVGNCSPTVLNNNLHYIQDSVSFKQLPDAGSLRMRMPGNCFSANTRSGWNRFDFVSPTVTDWNAAKGYSYTVKTNITGITVQSLLKVRKANGDIKMKLDSGSEPAFIPLSPLFQWRQIQFVRPAAEAGEVVLAVHVRVFLSQSALIYTSPDAVIQLDQVVEVN